jgi:hypothetical protein
MLGIAPRTARRDGAFAAAVNRILAGLPAGQRGAAKALLLGSRLGRNGIFELAATAPDSRRQLLEEWLALDEVPVRERRPGRSMFSLPRRPLAALVAGLTATLTPAEIRKVRRGLRNFLAKQPAQTEANGTNQGCGPRCPVLNGSVNTEIPS